MPDGGESLTLRTHPSILEISAAAWNDLAARTGQPYNPFVSHAFPSALEASGSVGGASGWRPFIVTLEDAGAFVAAAPTYLKEHSQGEYIFDHHWADAYERAGGRYYPKLMCASPFTPATGPRLLAADGPTRTALAAGLADAADRLGLSSVHVNFTIDADMEAAAAAGFLERRHRQYHWFNRGFSDFEDFLATLSSRKRKAIRRERRDAAESGLVIRQLRGTDITERHWDRFWAFYQDTGARKWGRPYLTRTFFRLIAETMSDDILLIVAERSGDPVAGALNFIGGDALYGRYWGCTEHTPFLHFELCYYQAIDFAIANGLARVEAGAQGEHKIARGYEPVATRSMHWIADRGFRKATADYLEREREGAAMELAELAAFTPFRRG